MPEDAEREGFSKLTAVPSRKKKLLRNERIAISMRRRHEEKKLAEQMEDQEKNNEPSPPEDIVNLEKQREKEASKVMDRKVDGLLQWAHNEGVSIADVVSAMCTPKYPWERATRESGYRMPKEMKAQVESIQEWSVKHVVQKSSNEMNKGQSNLFTAKSKRKFHLLDKAA